jgi:hypothetical protein
MVTGRSTNTVPTQVVPAPGDKMRTVPFGDTK